MKKEKTAYIEPEGYFPKELRKKFKLGEYNTDEDNTDKRAAAAKDKKDFEEGKTTKWALGGDGITNVKPTKEAIELAKQLNESIEPK